MSSEWMHSSVHWNPPSMRFPKFENTFSADLSFIRNDNIVACYFRKRIRHFSIRFSGCCLVSLVVDKQLDTPFLHVPEIDVILKNDDVFSYHQSDSKSHQQRCLRGRGLSSLGRCDFALSPEFFPLGKREHLVHIFQNKVWEFWSWSQFPSSKIFLSQSPILVPLSEIWFNIRSRIAPIVPVFEYFFHSWDWYQ